MTDEQAKIAAAVSATRVYEYVADDGTVYWSLTKHLQTVSPPKRLYLQSRVGTHLINFLTRLRQKVEQEAREEAG
jgi:hypothetical protein